MKSKMTTHRQQGMGRRQFLVVSSTCALATAVVGPKVFASDATASPKRIAVGFTPFGENARLSSAASVPAGDGAFITRGARISISGSSGRTSDGGGRRAVELLAHYSYLEGAERLDAPFRAWASGRNGSQGGPVSFNVPVDETQKIVLSVSTEKTVTQAGKSTSRRRAVGGAKTTELESAAVTLTLLSGGGIKLTRGSYVFVPLFDGDSDPRWSAYELRSVDGRWGLYDTAGEAAPFEHFVIRIDYAS